ncbi:phospholipase A2 inhibitor and Ly6/PLAUR domain-containing protein-like [Mixophyes fleayi]|uniref:phospholipase A2 inhibitor and Ly6/PLAUR domain-containing protein-like n=1 Tax=Mixophyes fleayi TaxID=3061075 RepID=UPI003F4D7495
MNSLLLVFWVLLDLVTPGHTVKCFECYNVTSTYCTGQTTDCGSSICMSGLISVDDYTLFGRGCAPNASSCGVSGSVTSTQRAQLATSCCNSDNCDPPPLQLPSTDTLKNGVTCPTCASSNIETCKVECTGNEKRCVNVGITTSGASVGARLRGCATNSVCDFGNHTFDIAGVVYTLGIVCNDTPTVHLQPCFLFMAFVLASYVINITF